MALSESASSDLSLRTSLVEASRDAWKKRLIDISRRNNLLYYRPLVNGTLELPVDDVLGDFLAKGEPMPLCELTQDRELAAGNIRTIFRKGLENLEEKGLSTLFLTLGRCSWTADDGSRDTFAPILLFPVKLKFKGQDIQSTEVEIAGDLEVNPVLIHVLTDELNVKISAEEIVEAFNPVGEGSDDDAGDEGEGDGEAPTGCLDLVLELLNTRAKKVPGFSATPFAVIGNFSFQKLAMVKDLENRYDDLIRNEVVAAIAGDMRARATLSATHVNVDPKTLDSVCPNLEFAVMEADSSQQTAISGIMAGQSAVVHGPPGTGKSQTITNLVATLAANGKKILFVAEKRAALEVVINRLVSVGLDHLAIDLHGADLSPKKVMEQVAKTLSLVRDATEPDANSVHSAFEERRDRLNKHDERVHKIHQPAALSVFQMQGLILRLPPSASTTLRWRGSELSAITSDKASQVRDLLGEASGFATLFNLTDQSPWCGLTLPDGQSAQNALDLVSRLAHEELPSLISSLAEVALLAGLRTASTMDEAAEVVASVASANEILSQYQDAIFSEAESLVQGMARGHVKGLKGLWARLMDAQYKQAVKQALALRTAGRASKDETWDDVNKASAIFKFWQSWSAGGDLPCVVETVDSCWQQCERVRNSLREAVHVFKFVSKQAQLDDMLRQFQKLASENSTPYRVSRVCELERKLKDCGVQRLVDEIRITKLPEEDWIPRFDFVWLSSTLDLAAISDPGVRAFVGATHNRYVEDFKQLDVRRIELAAARVRRAHGEHAIEAMNAYPDQESLIRSEASKSRRHRPLRKIFAEASDVLTAVCPCWMASPLSVCQLLGPDTAFDYVIFDEASQILPEDAIPSIVRAKHVIVAGDNRQLPPTTFFAATEENEEEVDGTGYESLLDMMISLREGIPPELALPQSG